MGVDCKPSTSRAEEVPYHCRQRNPKGGGLLVGDVIGDLDLEGRLGDGVLPERTTLGLQSVSSMRSAISLQLTGLIQLGL